MQVLSERGGWPMSHRFLALDRRDFRTERVVCHELDIPHVQSQRGTVLVIGRHPLRDGGRKHRAGADGTCTVCR